jgi:hypothetical protein
MVRRLARKIGLLILMALALACLTAAHGPAGVCEANGTNRFTCSDGCMYNYSVCINSGKSQSYCLSQYQTCQANCAGGSPPSR